MGLRFFAAPYLLYGLQPYTDHLTLDNTTTITQNSLLFIVYGYHFTKKSVENSIRVIYFSTFVVSKRTCTAWGSGFCLCCSMKKETTEPF